MIFSITQKLYDNNQFLTYLRYHPQWYMVLDKYPDYYKEFEKEAKIALKITTQDKINNFRKQLDFINGIIKYLNSQ